MPDLNSWLGDPNIEVAQNAARAAYAWRRIQDRPTAITIQRGQAASRQILEVQMVRLEWDNRPRWNQDAVNNKLRSVHQVVVFGVRGHPRVDDTDIQQNDRFRLDDVDYQVMSVIKPPGEVQAICEATG